MQRFRNSLITAGIAASGFAMFTYISAVSFAVLSGGRIFYRYQFDISLQEVPLFIGAFLLFESVFFRYIKSLIRTRQKEITIIRKPLLWFIIDTAAIALIIACILLILRAVRINVIVKSTAIISLIFFCSYFFLSAARIITNLLLIKLCIRAGFLPILSDAATVSAEELNSSAERLYNHCLRFGIPIAFIGIRIHMPAAVKKALSRDEVESFCEQAAFNLTENSRSYEPWFFSPHDLTYMCAVQIKDSQELNATLKRFSAVISKTQTLYFEGNAMPELKITADIYTTGSFDALRGRSAAEIVRNTFVHIAARLNTQKEKEVVIKDSSV